MATMDMQVVVKLGTQTVNFKYKQSPRSDRLRDLDKQKGIRIGMIEAFARAKEASAAAADAFDAYVDRGSANVTPAIPDIMRTYFGGASSDPELETVRRTFAAVRSGLHGDITLADDMSDADAEGGVDIRKAAGGTDLMKQTITRDQPAEVATLRRSQPDLPDYVLTGYTRGIIQQRLLARLGTPNLRNIHIAYRLCEGWCVDGVARVIVHEASHRFAGTGDVAYAGTKPFSLMPASLAVINADSYAYAAIALLRRQLVSHDQLIKSSDYAYRQPRTVNATESIEQLRRMTVNATETTRELPPQKSWWGLIGW